MRLQHASGWLAVAALLAASPTLMAQTPTGTRPRTARLVDSSAAHDSTRAAARKRVGDTASAATAPTGGVVCADGEKFPAGSDALCLTRGGVDRARTGGLQPRGQAPAPGEPGSDTAGREAFPSPWKSPWVSPGADTTKPDST